MLAANFQCIYRINNVIYIRNKASTTWTKLKYYKNSLTHIHKYWYTQIPLLISKTEFLRRKNAYEYNEPFKQNHTVSLEMQKKTTNKTTEKWAPQYILHCRRKQKNSIILTHSMSLYQIEFLCMYMYEKERTIRSNNSKNENKLNE